MKGRVIAIVPAAGRGRRMCSEKEEKPFLEISGRSVLLECLSRMNASDTLDGIIVVAGRDQVERVERMTAENRLDKVLRVITGGDTRSRSVKNAMDTLDLGAADIVLIHDGVRPFITEEMILRSVRAAIEKGAAVTAIPCSSTLKEVSSGGMIVRTMDRSVIWEAQTPQAFRFPIIKSAYESGDLGGATDDAFLAERAGHPVSIVKGDRRNMKVTVPEDLKIAEAMMASMEKG
ncbi:MAG: 2-C-methyl-D-erythritol 4-phosphate cytidylyltransferase [Candidatus Omnitrophica bacterium]|nr:2-C-methyl-D-erythritol 4-phosphate cytidylyltransferase [Candidatus Omnitrophota bacterium]